MLKYKVLSIILVMMLILSGCASNDVKITESYEFNADFVYSDQAMKIKVIHTKNNKNCLKILEPDNLKDIEINSENDKIYITIMGLTTEFDTKTLPEGQFCKAIIDTLNQLENNEKLAKSMDNNGNIFVEVDGKECKLTFDKTTRILQKIEVPSIKFTADIYDFKDLTQEK